MEEVDYLAALLLKQLRQEITAEELRFLENWKASHPSHARLYERVNDEEQLLADLLAMKATDMDGWWQKISAQITPIKRTVPFYKRWYTYATAAMVLLIAGALTWQYWEPKKLPEPANEKYMPAVVDVKPGGNKATLTLSNGTVVDVGGAANGMLAKEGSVTVVKVKDGELKYEAPGGATGSRDMIWNTLSTPRGGQYSLVLPDGSKAWLNAASSIKYPAWFSAAGRKVFITGEVYFDIAGKGTTRPFKVIVPPQPGGPGGAAVEVLGTTFDIMAYEDEADIRTTLLKGKLKVSALRSTSDERSASKLLAPGQQAQIPYVANAGKDPIKIVDMKDAEDVLGWKNGLVSFENAGIRSIMRTISRWYNIDVAYEGQTPPYKFTGKLPLKENLSAVIRLLEYEGIRFKMQQNKIIVLP